jgi:tetratricopeptide (TPR) repeat protein
MGEVGDVCILGKEILELNFEYFKTLLNNSFFKEGRLDETKMYPVNCFLPNGSAMSKAALECFKSYVYEKKITAPTLGVLEELHAWASFLNDATFQEDCANSIIDYLISKEHGDEFEIRYVEGHQREFVMRYLKERGISCPPDNIIISLSAFCHLAQEKTSPALEFVVSSIFAISFDDLVNKQNIDLLVLIPIKFRRSVQLLGCRTENCPSLESIRQLQNLFPNSELSLPLLKNIARTFPPDDEDPFRSFLAGRLAYEKNDLNQAETHYKKALELDPKDLFTDGYIGDVYRLQAKLGLAQEHLARAIKLNPKNSFACGRFGEIYRQQSNLEKAQEQLKEAVKLNPQGVFAQGSLGDVYGRQGEFELAQRHLEKAIELEPHDFWTRNSIGNVYLRQGNLEKAQEHFEKAVELDPQKSSAHYDLGNVYRRQGNLEKAQEHFEKAVELDPQNFFVQYDLGKFYRRQGNLEKAQKHFEKAVVLDPQNVQVHYDLGEVYLRQGNLEKAQEHWEKPVELHPLNASVWLYIGNFYREHQNNLGKAQECLEKAVELDPEDTFARSCLGEVYRQQGNLEKAQEHLKIAVELNPQDSIARKSLALVHKEKEASQALPKDGDPMDISDERSQSALKRKTSSISESEGPQAKKAKISKEEKTE